MINRYILLIFLILLTCEYGFSQTYSFREFSVSEGLPQGYIYDITQAQSGNLWVATGEGIARYNGKDFDIFREKDGLSENFITLIKRGNRNNLWIGHFNGGVTLFNGSRFIPVKTENILSSPVKDIFTDDKGNAWIGSQSDGLIKVNQALKIIDFSKSFIEQTILSISKNMAGNLLVGTDNGLFKLREEEGGKLKIINHWLKGEVIQVLEKKSPDVFWIGTMSGKVLLINSTSGEMKDFALHKGYNDNINVIFQENSNLWISSYGKGVAKYSLKKDTLLLVEEYNESTGLPSAYVHSFFIDRENNIWFGTFGSGLVQLDNPMFQIYSGKNGLPSDKVTAVTVDSTGALWVALENHLMLHSGKNKGFDTVFVLPDEGIQKITSLSPGLNNSILIGTDGNGIYSLNNVRSTPTRVFYSGADNLLNKINDVTTDPTGNIWAATYSGAVNITPEGNHEIYKIKDGLAHNFLHSVYCHSDGRIYFATHGGGITYYNNKEIKKISSPFPSSGLEINCFTGDQTGNLYIGTYGQGVFCLANEEYIKRYTTQDGLISNYCYLIQTDNNGNIWVGHKSGISKINPVTHKISRYYKKEGFELEELTANAISEDREGNLWIGSANGLIRYNIKIDKPDLAGPIVNLTGLDLFYQNVDWSRYSDSVYGLAKLPGKLVLPYNKNHLTFKVMGTTLSPSTEKVKYQYKLEGFENDWSLVSEENFITYANLPPGKYSFKVRAGNQFGSWNELENPFLFTIVSPFWETWWFILISVLSGTGMVAFIIKARTDNLRKQRERLKREKVKLEAEIRERIKAQKQQKIVEAKLIQTNKELNNFIYRSSHDLRGPISTMKGLTQLGMMEIEDEKSKKFINLIMDRTLVLDSILKNLIDVVEVIEGEITLGRIDLEDMVNSTISTLKEKEEYRGVDTKLELELNSGFYNDEKLVQSIFRNLIENSLKYIDHSKKKKTVNIKIREVEGGIKVDIQDNGIGIEPNLKDKVFDMFFRGSDQSKGSGLGLYTVNKIVDKLDGTIQLSSKEKEGTLIEMFLPNYNKKVKRVEMTLEKGTDLQQ